jgi:hypothetical protein
MPDAPLGGLLQLRLFRVRTMSDKFKSLDANERAALESTLYRCRALVGRIGEELRKKKPEHFVDERSLADFHASLEHAASVLEQTIKTTRRHLQRRACRRGAVSVISF